MYIHVKTTILAFLFLFLAQLFFLSPISFAQYYGSQFYKAIIISDHPFQYVEVQLLEGPQKGKVLKLNHGQMVPVVTPDLSFSKGDIAIVREDIIQGKAAFSIYDKYRLNQLIIFTILFFIAVFFVSGKRTIGSILGLVISVAIILMFIVPQIIKGNDPLQISILGALFILLSTIYFAHGFKIQTTLALVSTLLSLVVTGFISQAFVSISGLTGLGTETASLLQLGFHSYINFNNLLLGGIIIATLGILEDVTTAQTSAVFELHHSNPKMEQFALFKKALRIGHEHIASLVNTLVLVYAGASLSLFVLIVLNPAGIPYWVLINNEDIAQEIIRTLASSLGLVIAVPFSTILAVLYIKKFQTKK